MRKILLLLIFGLFIHTAEAQEWIGGSFGMSSSKEKHQSRLNNFKIVPEFGTHLSGDIAVGMKLGYAHVEERSGLDEKLKFNGWMVAPFIRYTFLEGIIGSLFVDTQISYARGKEKNNHDKYRELEMGVYPGVQMDLSERLALIGKFGFLGYTYEKMGHSKTNSWGLELDMDRVELGLIFKL